MTNYTLHCRRQDTARTGSRLQRGSRRRGRRNPPPLSTSPPTPNMLYVVHYSMDVRPSPEPSPKIFPSKGQSMDDGLYGWRIPRCATWQSFLLLRHTQAPGTDGRSCMSQRPVGYGCGADPMKPSSRDNEGPNRVLTSGSSQRPREVFTVVPRITNGLLGSDELRLVPSGPIGIHVPCHI